MLSVSDMDRDEAERLRVLARLTSMSIRQIARRVGLSWGSCHRLLSGDRRPRPGELDRVAAVLGVRREEDRAS